MDIEKIKLLADVLNEKGLASLELEEGDTRIKMERGNTGFLDSEIVIPVVNKKECPTQVGVPLEDDVPDKVDFNNLKEIKSPMVGVFYAAPSPESKPFVKIGDKVKKGDILCVIEAMKLMNDITSDYDGEIIDICVNNGDIVEFSQTLFKIV